MKVSCLRLVTLRHVYIRFANIYTRYLVLYFLVHSCESEIHLG